MDPNYPYDNATVNNFIAGVEQQLRSSAVQPQPQPQRPPPPTQIPLHAQFQPPSRFQPQPQAQLQPNPYGQQLYQTQSYAPQAPPNYPQYYYNQEQSYQPQFQRRPEASSAFYQPSYQSPYQTSYEPRSSPNPPPQPHIQNPRPPQQTNSLPQYHHPREYQQQTIQRTSSTSRPQPPVEVQVPVRSPAQSFQRSPQPRIQGQVPAQSPSQSPAQSFQQPPQPRVQGQVPAQSASQSPAPSFQQPPQPRVQGQVPAQSASQSPAQSFQQPPRPRVGEQALAHSPSHVFQQQPQTQVPVPVPAPSPSQSSQVPQSRRQVQVPAQIFQRSPQPQVEVRVPPWAVQQSPQPRVQVNIPAQSSKQSPQQQQPQYPVQFKSEPQSPANVAISLPSPAMASNPPQKKRERSPSNRDLQRPAKRVEQAVARTSPQTQRQTPQQNNSRVLVSVEANSKPKQIATKPPERRPSPVQPVEPELDYPSFLCVLADDFLEAAREQPTLTEEYYELVASALGCVESVLINFKLSPLKEAQLSLRYAQILYEETDNYDEAETMLTKSIELCERHKYIELKYEMQLLLSKVLYESKPKAALRDLERMINDIEEYGHTVWLYVFRFQHAMFSLASAVPGQFHAATVQLEKIGSLARQKSDSAILAFAAVLEALLHLSSSSHDSITATRTALAKASAMQLDKDVKTIPQLSILTDIIDLACSVRECNIVETQEKRQIMIAGVYEALASPYWRDDGFIYIPIANRAIGNIPLQGHGHIIEEKGAYFLPFTWLGKEQMVTLCHLFSADSSAHKEGADGGKASKFIDTALSNIRSWGAPTLGAGYQQFHRSYLFQRLLEAQLVAVLGFIQCTKGLWQAARGTLTTIRSISEDLGEKFPLNLRYALFYLEGVILQGTGDLTAALALWQSPAFNLGTKHLPSNGTTAYHQISASYNADSDVTRNFCILADMNSALILHNPQHPQHHKINSLINSLTTLSESSGNKYIKAHYSLLVSVLSYTTLTTKHFLKTAMEDGNAIGNVQTSSLAFVYMYEKLFKGTVDSQASKCAKAASRQIRRWGDPLWVHMAALLEAEAFEVCGMMEEASKRKDDAAATWEKVPEAVKKLVTA